VHFSFLKGSHQLHCNHILHVVVLTRVFVGCDILSFLVQGSGSGIASSDNWKGNSAKIGTDVLIAGLGSQVATFVVFLAVFIRFHQLARHSAVETAPRHWQKLVVAVYISSFLILVGVSYAKRRRENKRRD
jgi:hypothetical protein